MAKIHPSLPEMQYGLARRFAAKRLFRRMLSRQHIDLAAVPDRASEAVLYRALHTCSRCAATPACAAWLAGNAPAAGYVNFCPNAEAIETLRIFAG